MKHFKLQPPKEKIVQAGCADLLKYRLAWHARTNSGASGKAFVLQWLVSAGAPEFILAWVRKASSRRFVKFNDMPEGMAMLDHLGQTKDGRIVMAEWKQQGKKPTPAQLRTIEVVNEHGGIAFWADSVDSADMQLTKLQRGK